MRTSTVLTAAASLLISAVAVSAECGQLTPSETAVQAACGDAATIIKCIESKERCVPGCLKKAGCSEDEAASFAAWLKNDCAEVRSFSAGDLRMRKRQLPKLSAGDEAEGDDKDADTKANDAAAAESKAADDTAKAAEETKAAPAETPAPADATPTEADKPAGVTITGGEENTENTGPTGGLPKLAADETSVEGESQVTNAPGASKAKSLVCLTTRYKDGSSCTKIKGEATSKCVPAKTPEVACAPGLLCQMTDKGNQICMVKENTPIMSGIIITCFLAVFLSAMIGTVVFMACKTRKEEMREKKQAEALAIANGQKEASKGSASDAYLPLIHEPGAGGMARGRGRDSSADPFGSGRNSRRPSALGMPPSPGGSYGGMGQRSPVESRAPSPLGMPGATEDISYGGRR